MVQVDVAEVTCISQEGDSGGCVAIIKNGGYATAGTILGHISSVGYVSKYANQYNILENYCKEKDLHYDSLADTDKVRVRYATLEKKVLEEIEKEYIIIKTK